MSTIRIDQVYQMNVYEREVSMSGIPIAMQLQPQEVQEQVALGIVEYGARMIAETIQASTIRPEAVSPQQRYYVEHMIRQLRGIMPRPENG